MYRFTNQLGATYKGGSLECLARMWCRAHGMRFTPDGNVLLSPVGNRVNAVDLVQGKCVTLAPENREDVAVLALSQAWWPVTSCKRPGWTALAVCGHTWACDSERYGFRITGCEGRHSHHHIASHRHRDHLEM